MLPTLKNAAAGYQGPVKIELLKGAVFLPPSTRLGCLIDVVRESLATTINQNSLLLSSPLPSSSSHFFARSFKAS